MNGSLPEEFIRRMSLLLGDDETGALVEALGKDAAVSIRLNKAKGCRAPDGGVAVPWSESGYYLCERPSFTLDPLFHAGCYYVQEASSMFLEHVLRQLVKEPVVMLDLCAAPGGKSTLAISALPEGSLLFSNEVIRSRAQILYENVVKWGHDSVVVTNNDVRDFQRAGVVADVILADVPCSGEGMMRKDLAARDEWSPGNVSLCQQRQRRIVGDAWRCLRQGGLLIYSTCTFNREENEDNVAWIADCLGAEVVEVDVPESWGITGNLSGRSDQRVYRFFPHKTPGEGFCMAALRKTSDDCLTPPRVRKEKSSVGTFPKELKGWVTIPDRYAFSLEGGVATAFPKRWEQLIQSYRKAGLDTSNSCRRRVGTRSTTTESGQGHGGSPLRLLGAGITLGEMKGKDWQPNQSLAMSTSLNRGVFPEVEVILDQALAYLRREAIALDGTSGKGYVLLTYQGHPIGFIKNVGNRANNLYPESWRIRRQISEKPTQSAWHNL